MSVKNQINKLLVIGIVYPQAHTTAAGFRMLQILNLFKNQGYHITYWYTNQSDNNSPAHEVIDESLRININDQAVENLLKHLIPNVVMYDRFIAEEQFGWRIKAKCPEALTILDTEDLHFIRKAREIQVKSQQQTPLNLQNDVFVREMASILRCDLSLIISKVEYRLLVDEFKISEAQLFYLPFLWDGKMIHHNTAFENRQHFFCLGNFLHLPNKMMVTELYKHWPLIKQKLPQAQLHCYGAYADNSILQLHQPHKGFYIKGIANNLNTLYQNYKLMLAPLTFGAGLKGKIFESMQNQLPVLSTPIGWEGYDLSKNNLLCSNLWEEFIQNAITLYNNQFIWEKSIADYSNVLQNMHQKAFEDVFIAKINYLTEHLSEHRHKHFFMAILHQENMQSKKFMSLWIEAKNKL